VLALCLGDADLSLRRATATVLPFLRDRAAEAGGRGTLNAALIVSMFDYERRSLLTRMPQDIRNRVVRAWERSPVCAIDAVWITMNDQSLRFPSVHTIDLTQGGSLWQSEELPILTLSEVFIATDTRHDHRLVPPDSPDAKFVAVTKDGKPIAGWSGIRKTLDQFPLCLRDVARCTDEIRRGDIFGVEEVDMSGD
jgi:hypothetical protein